MAAASACACRAVYEDITRIPTKLYLSAVLTNSRKVRAVFQPSTTSIVYGYASSIISNFNRELLKEQYSRKLGASRTPVMVELETIAWYNRNLESKYYYIPCLIAIMLVLISLILTSISIVREKEIGTIEQIMVTPVGRMEFILGKTIPYLLLGYVIMSIMLLIMYAVFGVYVKGSLLLFYLLSGIFIVGNLGMALTISTTASTQQQALLTAFFVLMPAVLLSGFVLPVESMPEIVQYGTYLNPMRWFIDIIRGVVMKGVGVESIWQAIIGQTVIASMFVGLAAATFRKTLR